MTIQSDILFIPEDFSTSQLNKRTEYLVEYLKECSLIARELSIEFDREFPGAQISLKRSASSCGGSGGEVRGGALIQLQFWRKTTQNTRRKSCRSKPAEPRSTMRCRPRQRSFSGCANTAVSRTISSQRPEILSVRDPTSP